MSWLRRHAKAVVFGVVVLAVMVVWTTVLEPPSAQVVQRTVSSLGWWAPGLFVVVAALLAVLCVPTSLLNVTAGLAFGPVVGFVLAWLAQLVAAMIGFGVMRLRRRSGVAPETSQRSSMVVRVAEFVGAHPTSAIMVVRAAGVFPFGPTNFALGFTSVRWRSFVVGTAVGTVPGTLATVLVGASGADPRSPFLWLGVLAVVLLAVVGALVTRRLGTK